MERERSKGFDIDSFDARLDLTFRRLRTDLVSAMFVFWAATVFPVGGLMLALSGGFCR